MLRLRPPGAGVSTAAAFRAEVLAWAGVILSAICAMMVPRPTMKAAKIMMLRITPHSVETRRYHHVPGKAATNGGGEGCHFDEKDERSVNRVPRGTPAGSGRAGT